MSSKQTRLRISVEQACISRGDAVKALLDNGNNFAGAIEIPKNHGVIQRAY
jgi:hypothetical protein